MQDMAKSRPINMKGQKGFKMLVLNETDRLSAQAQHSLRRTMEKYSASCRLVLCCNNVSKVKQLSPTTPAAMHSSACKPIRWRRAAAASPALQLRHKFPSATFTGLCHDSLPK